MAAAVGFEGRRWRRQRTNSVNTERRAGGSEYADKRRTGKTQGRDQKPQAAREWRQT
jgi:hypothetical protein